MIKETLSNAIRSLSNKYEIQPNELRIKISKKNDSLKYEILKNTDVIEETNLATALNLNTISSFMVGNRLNTIIDGLVKEHQVPNESINVRIYTKTDECEPLIYLFDGGKPKQPLDIDKLT
jgi:hypothetical protein